MARSDTPSIFRSAARPSRARRWKPATGWIGAVFFSLAAWWGVAELLF